VVDGKNRIFPQIHELPLFEKAEKDWKIKFKFIDYEMLK